MPLYRVLFPLAIPGGFTYSHDSSIPPGMRVVVDFRGKKRIGIVWGETEAGEYEIKPIEEVLDKSPVLSKESIETIEFVSNYYLSFRGLALKSALPKRVFEIFAPIELGKEDFDSKRLILGYKPALNAEQEKAYRGVDLTGFAVNLLFGVTGSGKTEVYLRLIEDILLGGKKALVLVPEIVLTPQYVDIFINRFGPDIVGVFHSRLTPKVRFENWLGFLKGSRRILIGTRSAVFATLDDVGLIVIDEENDESYKQESEPRYNARDLAIYRARRLNIPVVLCSATPSLESYYKAKSGKYRLFRLKKRVQGVPLPEVEMVHLKSGKLFADHVIERMKDVMDRGRGVAVLINRRGFANYLVCADCGYLFSCPNCSVTLTYHKKTNNMKCHWCDSVYPVPESCPRCGSFNVIDRGIGAQRVEEELRRIFPDREIERFDRDSVASKKEFDRILNKLRNGKIDILVGTQMLSKGHDISHIGLVVIANLEQLFSIADFRARERAIALIIQTSGRAGRKEAGEVIIQTVSGERGEIVEYILNHDYESFAENELGNRKIFRYPPFSRLIRVIAESTTNDKAKAIIDNVAERLKDDVPFIGPARCPLYKIKNRYRYHLLIKTDNVLKTISIIREKVKDMGRNVHFDVDPLSFF